jgi:quinol monooxygenase YgiN
MIRKHALRSILAIIVFLSVCSIAPPAKELAGAQQPEKAALQKGKSSMRYGRFGKMTTRPGKRDAVVAILLRDIEKAKAVGCDLYVVNMAPDNPDDIWVTEVWTSRESHRASLQLPSVKQAIAEAMPMLTGEFQQIEVDVVGGLGLPARTDPAKQ